MFKLKQSLVAFPVLVICVGALASLMPLVGLGQGGSQNSPPFGPRRFYLTQTTHNGSQALTACAEGYHMASLWEIFDTSNLKYNTTLGLTMDDSGSGPPTNQDGWIRTGNFADNASNCNRWTSDSFESSGKFVRLDPDWISTEAKVVSPWFSFNNECIFPISVWCMQD